MTEKNVKVKINIENNVEINKTEEKKICKVSEGDKEQNVKVKVNVENNVVIDKTEEKKLCKILISKGDKGEKGQDGTVKFEELTEEQIAMLKGEPGAKNYNELDDKPIINNIVLEGSKTLEDLGIQAIGNYATETFVTDAIENAKIGEEIDLSDYATKDDLLNKVDKVIGKSLIDDTEIERLKTINNYDDSEIKEILDTKANLSDIPTVDLTDYYTKEESDGLYQAQGDYVDTTSNQEIGGYKNFKNFPTCSGVPTSDMQLVNGAYVKQQMEEIGGGDTLPIGTMLPIGTTNTEHIPANWLVCDGREVSRTAYEKLFNVIGTNYGAGDGSTTFNLPDKRGRVSVGLDEAQNEFNAIGKKGGSKYLQAHKHNVLDGSYGNPTTITGYNDASGYNSPSIRNVAGAGTGGKLITDTVGTGDSGNLQPYEIDNWIIKALNGETEIPEETMATVTNEYSESTEKLYSCDFINSGLSNKEDKQLVVDYEGTPNASSFVIDGLHLDTNYAYDYVIVAISDNSTGFRLFYNGDETTGQYYRNYIDTNSSGVLNGYYDRDGYAPRIGVTGTKPSLIDGVIRKNEHRLLNNFTCCNLEPSWRRISLGLQAYTNAPDVLTSLKFNVESGKITYLSVKIYRRGN